MNAAAMGKLDRKMKLEMLLKDLIRTVRLKRSRNILREAFKGRLYKMYVCVYFHSLMLANRQMAKKRISTMRGACCHFFHLNS